MLKSSVLFTAILTLTCQLTFAEHLLPEAALVVLAVIAIGVFRVGVPGSIEGVSRCSETHDGLAGIEVVDEVLHLFVREVLETQEDDHEVGRFQVRETRDPGAAGLDEAGLLVGGEEDAALEAVVLRQDPAERGKGLLAAVLVVTGDQHDVLALAGAGFALPDHSVGMRSKGELAGEDQQRRKGD